MAVQSYTECFWGGGLTSTDGYDALCKRNHDAKRMCEELEDYLKRRSKLEQEFSKSLRDLAKCFKPKEEIGDLEKTINAFRSEVDTMASVHSHTSVLFSEQAHAVKSFRDDQTAKAKLVEDDLKKAQKDKINQLRRTLQSEKNYVKKCNDRDTAQNNLKEVDKENLKESAKAKAKHDKAQEDAQKSDDVYRSEVFTLEESTITWEEAMKRACTVIQELDKKRVRYLRNELWRTVNTDSKMALDIDTSCEKVRQNLELCDISQEITSFMNWAGTGNDRPKHYTFRHHSTILGEGNSDAGSSISSIEDDKGGGMGTLTPRNGGRMKHNTVFNKSR